MNKRALALVELAPAHSPIFTSAQAKAMLPTYERLADEKLLSQYIQGNTHNVAGSFNKIWLLSPKTGFASHTVVKMATSKASSLCLLQLL